MLDLARLHSSGLVRTIDYHPALGSTSDRALELAAQGDTELPLLVIADQQTAGRGRGANRWLSSGGALTFSLALEAPHDRLPQARWPEVALVTGLAVCRALQDAAPRAELRVKWPNDVYLDGQKVCGILSESVPGWRDRLVVGIGVNVNNRVAGSAISSQPDRLKSAISLLEHDGAARDLTAVLIALLDEFEQVWQRLTSDDRGALVCEYRDRCFLTGKTVIVAQAPEQKTVGLCLGIDDFGRLRLQTQTGLKSIASGAIVGWEA